MNVHEFPRGAWLVQARHTDGAPAFWNRFATSDAAHAWADAQRDGREPGQLRYTFDVTCDADALDIERDATVARICAVASGREFSTL